MRQVVVGIGNPIFGDDAVGLEVAKKLRGRVKADVKEAMAGGFGLLEMILGYEKAVLVDAILTEEKEKVGRVTKFVLKPSSTGSLKTPHALSLLDAMFIAKEAGIREVPKKVVVVGIYIDEVSFKDEMSENVKMAIPVAVKVVEDEINGV